MANPLEDPNAVPYYLGPQEATPTPPTQSAPVELPPLPKSGGVFNVPVLGPILDVMRDIVVGPNADYLNTREQVTRGILNSLVLAKNPGALPAMYQRYDVADANEFQKYQDPRFRERVDALKDPGGPFRLPEADAISRAADEFQISTGVTRPKSLAELPSPDPAIMSKFKVARKQADYLRQGDRPASFYQAVGPYPPERVKEAHDHVLFGLPLTPEDKHILALEAAERDIPGANVETIDTSKEGAPGVKYKMGPRTYRELPGGGFVDNRGNVVAEIPGVTTPPTAGGTTPPPSVPGAVPTVPSTTPTAPAQKPLEYYGTWAIVPDENGVPTKQFVPFDPEEMAARERIRQQSEEDIRKSEIKQAGTEAGEARRYLDIIRETVGDYVYAKDPTTGEEYTLDTNGQRYTGAPGQIRAGTGIHQFLNPQVFSFPEIDVDETSVVSNIWGRVVGARHYVNQWLREGNKGDPQNRLLGRYDAWVNERVPSYLKMANVTRTTQTEINLLKQAFPDPKSMPLGMAIEMAIQLRGVMETRAGIAAMRLREAKEGKPLTPYPPITLETSQGAVTIPGGNPELRYEDTRPLSEFVGGEEEPAPQAAPAKPSVVETDDDIVVQ